MKYFHFEYIETLAKNILIEAEDEQDALERFNYIANSTDELCRNMNVLDCDTAITFEGTKEEADRYWRADTTYSDVDYKKLANRG